MKNLFCYSLYTTVYFLSVLLFSTMNTSATCKTNVSCDTVIPDLDGSASPRTLIHIPLCRQSTDYTCGVACLQSILGYYGEDIREDKLAQELGTTPDNGTDGHNIIKNATDRGYRVEMKIHSTINDLEHSIDKGIPPIVVIQAWKDDPETEYISDWDDGHYVIAVGYDAKNIYFMDPSTLGHYTFIPRDEFLQRWHDKDDTNEYVHMLITIASDSPPTPHANTITRLD